MHTQVAEVLIDIEAELRRLQFIFLPRMHALVSARGTLPSACGILPMAEEYFRDSRLPVRPLLLALDRVDRLLGGDAQPRAWS